MTDWKNRIIETADMAVKELKANPKNWRKHPTAQQNALAGVLDEVGWVTQVIWNRQTGHLVDGHLRVELAAKRKEKTIPVNVVDLSPKEEAMILATFDPIAAMAEADRQMLAGLMESIETEDEQIREMLQGLADEQPDYSGTILGAGESVNKDDRAGSSPWDRVEPSDKVRCIIGDVEFGCPRDVAARWVAMIKSLPHPSLREAAEAWMKQSTP